MLRREIAPGCALRLFEEGDVTELQAIIEANRGHLGRWLPWAGQGPRDTLAYIQRTRRALAESTALETAIVENGRIVGAIGTHPIDWGNRCAALGYWLAADAQGRGLMTRAARAYLEHAFTVWGLDRVELQVATANRRSRALATRLGFVHEGTRREAQRIGDRVEDLEVYGLLAAEWRP